MSREKIKTLLVNIATAAIAVGLITIGYFVFLKKDVPAVDTAATVAEIVEDTTTIAAEIDDAVRDLGDLEHAVVSSTMIFDLPAFKNLQDFSVVIQAEAVGRPNPFIPTLWKLKMKTLEETTR